MISLLCNMAACGLANKRADLGTLKLKHADEVKGIQDKEAEKGNQQYSVVRLNE